VGTPIYVEAGAKKAFACSVAWPGWCRGAKDEDAAIEALAAYAPRYAPVAAAAGLRFPRRLAAFDVVERVKGGGATDFGVPYEIPRLDLEPLPAGEARRQARLVGAAWTTLEDVAAAAPAALRKGPRGGGRDRDPIVEHVLAAEDAYARKLGVKAAPAQRRAALLAVLAAPSDGAPLIAKGWPSRYAARRIAWHVLDHAWEIEDRSC
jgi:hypothetical protein